MSQYSDGIWFETVHCGKCDIHFGMPIEMYRKQKRLRRDGGWYCPNGHLRVFVGESEEVKLKRELNEARRRNSKLASENAEVTRSYGKMRKRIRKGICPCCDKTLPTYEHTWRTSTQSLRTTTYAS